MYLNCYLQIESKKVVPINPVLIAKKCLIASSIITFPISILFSLLHKHKHMIVNFATNFTTK